MRDDFAQDFFKEELNSIQNEYLRNFALYMLSNAPDYFWKVGASSTGKYHPLYTLGELGLAKHVKAATMFLNYILELEYFQEMFTEEEKDCMRVAILLHDRDKHGHNGSQYTVFEHPNLIAEVIREWKGKTQHITDNQLEIIARCCESHMGQWNTNKRSSIILNKPNDNMTAIVHLADYLASRKNITIEFNDLVTA